MDYFKLLLIGSIVLFLTLGICCADDINSTNATSQSDAGTFNELQNLINESSQGSAINLTKDYLSGEGDDFPEGIRINKSITINGNNHVIDANSKSRMFFVTSPSDVVINNIIFVNGKGDVYGGAYLSDFGGTINNCVFKDNSLLKKFISDLIKCSTQTGDPFFQFSLDLIQGCYCSFKRVINIHVFFILFLYCWGD